MKKIEIYYWIVAVCVAFIYSSCSKDEKMDYDITGIWALDDTTLDVKSSNPELIYTLEDQLQEKFPLFLDTIQFLSNGHFQEGKLDPESNLTSPDINGIKTDYTYTVRKGKVYIVPSQQHIAYPGKNAQYQLEDNNTLKLTIELQATDMVENYIRETYHKEVAIDQYSIIYTYIRQGFYTR